MSFILYLFILVLLAAYLFHKYVYDYDYWKRKGVHFIKPLPFMGNLYNVFNFRYALHDLLEKFYGEVDLPYFGIYFLNTPCLIVKDPELIKSILIRDFSYFPDTIMPSEEKSDSLFSKTITTAKHPYWKSLRGKLSPIFSSLKMKNMFQLVNKVTEDQNIYIAKNRNNVIDTKELSTKYLTDLAASCLFGIHAHSFEEENAIVRNFGRNVFEFTYIKAFSKSCYIMAPALVRLFKLNMVDPSVAEGLTEVVLKTIRQREKSTHVRHDAIDTIIDMKKRGILDEECSIAQLIVLFLAAYDATSTSIAFTLYELALHPELQDKLRSEIQHDGAFTYENIQSKKYLNMVYSEALRKYPPLGYTDRVCIKDYTIPGTEIVIEKGTAIVISISGLHHDEKYFPEPEKFDPERFSDESAFYKFSYLPFGDGPRNCIGERLGVLAAKPSIARIISEYELEPCHSTPTSIKSDSKSFFLGVTGGLPLRFKKISSTAA